MKHIRLTMSLFLVLLGLALLSSPAYADVNNFTVTDFSADYYLSKSDPQGAMTIDEHLSVDFTDQNHGIERSLPKKYNGQDQHIKITKVLRDGTTEPYTTYTSNGNDVLRIGNATGTITGTHTYEIDYSVQNIIRFTGGADELDWNTNGTDWKQPFEHISATLHFPAGISTQNITNNRCVTGLQGSTASDCTVEAHGDGYRYQTTRVLNANENMTFVDSFPLGTFKQPTTADWWKEHIAIILEVAVPAVVAFTFAYRYWYKHGKDLKGRGTIVPEYAPPDGVAAAEADMISTYKLGNNAVSATIIDLAIRKYLKIIEGTSDGVLGIGKHKTYTFQKLPTPAGDELKTYEQTILLGLFAKGDSVQTTDLKNNFYSTVASVKTTIPVVLTKEDYFPENPKEAAVKLIFVCGGLVVGGFLLTRVSIVALGIGLLLAALAVGFFVPLMPRRTQKGEDAKDDLAGLKLYMNTAEKDRLAMLQSVDRPYAAQSSAPQQTVELFERLLPFAMIMGVENSWAKQFEGIYTTPPDWYGGNWTAFNTGLLVGSLNESMSAMNSSFAAPSSSGVGGGGGFSGGGGGGGGGGGW